MTDAGGGHHSGVQHRAASLSVGRAASGEVALVHSSHDDHNVQATLEHAKSGTAQLGALNKSMSCGPSPPPPAPVDVPEAEAEALQMMAPVAKNAQLTLYFHNVSGFVPANFQPAGAIDRIKAVWKRRVKGDKEATAAPQRQILHSVSGEVHPGEVLALMGPSGSGKTSLLSVLAGRAPKAMRVKGDILFNGDPMNKVIKRKIGYVLQDDLLYESLTVYETLQYAALLRLPSSMSHAEKLERVDVVLAALGLHKCRDTIIGGFFRRGISGGERKRVSVGEQLIIDPSMILLDEPTSGLDSTTAMHLVMLLRQLAGGNRSIATTIHQPSSRLYMQLDKLMLLGQGHTLYYGQASQVAAWFNHLGFELPYGVNVADHILDLAMGEAQHNTDETLKGQPAIRSLYHTFEQYARHNTLGYHKGAELAAVRLLEGADSTEAASTSGSSSSDAAPAAAKGATEDTGVVAALDVENATSSSSATSGNERQALKRVGATYPQQVLVLLKRCSQVKRFEAFSFQRILQIVVVALITGCFWWQRGKNHQLAGASDVIGLVFFILLFPALSAMFAALFTFPNDYRMLLKERASGMYRLSSFYIARTASDIPMDIALPTLFFIIVYFFGGLPYDAGVFFAALTSMLLVVLLAQSIGLLIGAVFMNPKTAQTVSTIVILTFMLVAGFYVRDIAVWISWLKYISFIYWSYNLLIKIIFSGAVYYSCDMGASAGAVNNAVGTPTADGCMSYSGENLKRALGLSLNPDDSPWLEIVVLFAMLFAARLAIYYVLLRKTAQRKG